MPNTKVNQNNHQASHLEIYNSLLMLFSYCKNDDDLFIILTYLVNFSKDK
jgi:hypothetical protein